MKSQKRSNERQEKIIEYLKKNPFSPKKHIADKYDSKKHNYDIVGKDITELVNNGKIESLEKLTNFYYVIPKYDEFDHTLSTMLKSEKILLPRFKNLKFGGYRDAWTLSKLIRNLICLFHLELKIALMEKKRTVLNKNAALTKYEITKLQEKFSQEWQASNFEPEPTTLQECIDDLSEWLPQVYFNYKAKFDMLRSNKASISKRFEILDAKLTQNNYRDAADLHGTTIKNVRKLATPIIDKRGKFDWLKTYELKQIEDGIGRKFDPYIVFLMLKSKARAKQIVDYIITSKNLPMISRSEYDSLMDSTKLLKNKLVKANLSDGEINRRIKQSFDTW